MDYIKKCNLDGNKQKKIKKIKQISSGVHSKIYLVKLNSGKQILAKVPSKKTYEKEMKYEEKVLSYLEKHLSSYDKRFFSKVAKDISCDNVLFLKYFGNTITLYDYVKTYKNHKFILYAKKHTSFLNLILNA